MTTEIQTTQAISPAIIVRLKQHEQEGQEALAIIQDLQVESEADYQGACETLLDVKAQYKAVEAEEKTITDPLWKAWKAAKDHFNPAKNFLVQCEKVLKEKVGTYTAAMNASRVAAMSTGAAIIPAPAEAPKGVSVREVQKWEVFDPDKVPREFCSPDKALIQEAVDNGYTAIPGVRFFMAAQVTARPGVK